MKNILVSLLVNIIHYILIIRKQYYIFHGYHYLGISFKLFAPDIVRNGLKDVIYLSDNFQSILF